MNSFPLTKVGKQSIFVIRKKRSNAGKVRGPRAGPHMGNLPKLFNEGVMLPVPKGGAIVGVNYKGRNVHQSARGKLYVLGKTGRKMYTVHMEKPVRKTRKNKNVKRGPRHLPRNVNLFA